MAMWHVSRGGKQFDPVEQSVILSQIGSGQVLPSDLVWTDGMAEWKAVRDVPLLAAAVPVSAVGTAPAAYSTPAAAAGVVNYQMPHAGTVMCTSTAMESLKRTGPWTRFIAILCFVIGGLTVIGGLCGLFGMGISSRAGGNAAMPGGAFFGLMLILYGVIAAVYIILGLNLNRFSSSIKELMTYRREDQLEAAMEAQRKFWRLVGIIFATVIGLYAIGIAIVIIVALLKI